MPPYMIPTAILVVDALPLTPHGKLDIAALHGAPRLHAAANRLDEPDEMDASIQTLATIWEDVLQVRPIRTHDNFFDLGGHSLLAVRLFQRIEQKYGWKPPLSTLFQDGTLAHLHRVLLHPSTPPPFAFVPLREHGDRPPLILLPGHDGQVLRNRLLVEQLGDDQPVFGIEMSEAEVQATSDRTLEDIAADIVTMLRTHQPVGPYHLGGYSFGGVLAYEVARQLREAGQDVPVLALFDTPCPLPIVPLQRSGTVHAVDVAEFLARLTLGKAAAHAVVLRSLEPSARPRYIFSRARGVGKHVYASGAALLRSLRRDASTAAGTRTEQPGTAGDGAARRTGAYQTQRKHTHSRVFAQPQDLFDAVSPHFASALRCYVPQRYAGRIILYWGLSNPLGLLGPRDPRCGWRRLAVGGVDTYRVATDHTGIIGEWPQIQQIGRHLRAAITNAR